MLSVTNISRSEADPSAGNRLQGCKSKVLIAPGLMSSRLLWVVVLLFLPLLGQAETVKKSSSDICHGTESPYYETVKRYKAFSSLDSCVRSGGRLPLAGPHTREHGSRLAYTRDKFGQGWADEDGDCQNTRMEVLIEQSTLPVRFSAGSRCRVVYGRWISAFTGEVVQNGAEIQIDHLVPLKWAWDRGAQSWPQVKREQFANDPINLLPVEAHLNASKGAQGPDRWLPPFGRCGYVARFVRVIKSYELQPSPHESSTMAGLLDRCRK